MAGKAGNVCRPGLRYGVLLLLALMAARPVAAQESIVEVQSVFIYSFLNFVTWPEGAQSKTLCVYGNPSIADTLEHIREKQPADRAFTVRRLEAPGDAGSCHIVYIDSSLGTSRITAITNALSGKPVLTISDREQFPAESGIIGMGTKNNKPHIVVNEQRARDAGLKVSSRLLSIAEIAN